MLKTDSGREPVSEALELADVTGKLRALLKAEAILYANREQPIKDRHGFPAPWLFYSWNVSMSQEGAHLAGLAMLDRLRQFRSTQLATFGMTGIPLLSACLLLGGGKYRGICIRETRKKHGSCRQIEGQIDKGSPVVIVDDSLSSGTSLRKAIYALESEGVVVEGCLALVNFPWRGGKELAEALGYRVETLFDIWRDLEMPQPRYVAGFRRVDAALSCDTRIEDGLSPARVARLVAECFLSGTEVPQPPQRVDRQYDGRGGVYVSFRDTLSDYRIARDGFWHFEPADAEIGRDIVLATLKTLRSAQGAITAELLPRLKIAVTFFGPLERILPRQLDFDRYGIVVRSRTWETKIGGALPNTEVFTSEAEQYFHARVTNAKVGSFEPHDLYRHSVVKCVEEGSYWLPYGAPEGPDSDWTQSDTVGTQLTRRARQILLTSAVSRSPKEQGEQVPDDLIEGRVFAIAVTLYHQGTVGCSVAWQGSLDECLKRATLQAANDKRFRAKRDGVPLEDLAICVSVLHDREWLGEASVQRGARKLRLGLDSLAVQQENRRAILLSFVAPHYNWTKEQLATRLLQKAGITKPPYVWATFKTATWVTQGRDVHGIQFGFARPQRLGRHRHTSNLREDIQLLAEYIMNSRSRDGLPDYCYFPISGASVSCGSAARVVHALIALQEAGRVMDNAGWRDAARQGLFYCLDFVDAGRATSLLALPGQQPGIMADCQLLAGISDVPGALNQPAIQALSKNIACLAQSDGRIAKRWNGNRAAEDHDFMPGAALLALARLWAAQGFVPEVVGLERHLDWYRRRFRLLHRWGMIGWQTQAWAAIHRIVGLQGCADFVFEMADWAIDWQLDKNGAFITDLYPFGPSFHTAFVAEGIAAAWRVAQAVHDAQREARYAGACRRAASFMSSLVIHECDTYCMRDPQRAVGGVRAALLRSDVRIDFVSHTLLALVTGPLVGTIASESVR